MLEQLEEALRHTVVVVITSPAHAGLQIVARQEALPFMTGELTTLIGMHNDVSRGLLRQTAMCKASRAIWE